MNSDANRGSEHAPRQCLRWAVELDADVLVLGLAGMDADDADFLADLIEQDTCPRCQDASLTAFPARSRATSCRCIPICPPCGAHESYEDASRGVSPVPRWPVPDVAEDLARVGQA